MRTITPRESAPPVTHDHGASHRRRDHRGSPTDVERLGAGVHHDPEHRGVARDPPRDLTGDRTHVVELGRTLPGEGGRVNRDGEVGSFSTHDRAVDPIEPLAADLPESVGSALCWRTRVLLGP